VDHTETRNDAMNGEQVVRHLRYQIVGLMHVGRLRRGVPLPSIRGVARTLGVDHRQVAAAYRALEAEGLVEIRPGAGVFLAADVSAASPCGEDEAWLGAVLLEGWTRGLSRGGVGRLMERVAGTRLRCACVESNEDHMVAVAAELEESFSLDVRPVMVGPAPREPIAPALLADAELVVTTVFHAEAVRAAAAAAGKPCVVLRVHPGFAARVAALLHSREVMGVFVDPRYGARASAFLDVTPHRGQVRYVSLDQVGPEVELDSPATLLTRAARRRLGLADYHLVPSPPGYISPDSAGELFQAIAALGCGGEAGGLTEPASPVSHRP